MPLANIFRISYQANGEFKYAKKELAKISTFLSNTKYIQYNYKILSNNDYKNALLLLSILENTTNYLLRCEYNKLMIYSNDETVIDKISEIDCCVEKWKPNKNYTNLLMNQTNVIIVNKIPKYPYKLYFRKKLSKSLLQWMKHNTKNIKKIPSLNKNYNNLYIISEQIISIITLLEGQNLYKVDKLVYKGDIDK